MWSRSRVFYKELFCEKPSDPVARSHILDLVANKISKESAKNLVKSFTAKELIRAIKNSLSGRCRWLDSRTLTSLSIKAKEAANS